MTSDSGPERKFWQIAFESRSPQSGYRKGEKDRAQARVTAKYSRTCRACRSAAGRTGQSADLRMIWRRAPKLFLFAIFLRCKAQAVFVA
jgi:hypothetical protein